MAWRHKSSTLSSKHHKITFARSVSLCFSPWPVEFELDPDPLRGISHRLMSIPPSAAWADWRKKNFQKESSRVMLLNPVKSGHHVPNELSETLSVQLVSPNGPTAPRPNGPTTCRMVWPNFARRPASVPIVLELAYSPEKATAEV